MKTRLIMMSILLMIVLNPSWGQGIRVIAVPHHVMDPSVPHFAYNGHPTTFKAIVRGGAPGQRYYFRWDADGDGNFDRDPARQLENSVGNWYRDQGNKLDFVFRLPAVDPNVTSKKLFIARIEVAAALDAAGNATNSSLASYPVMVFAEVPSLQNANSATADQLMVMKEVAIDDALWALHKDLIPVGPPSAQMTGYLYTADRPSSGGSADLPNTALFALALLENGRRGAYPPGTYNSYGIPVPSGFEADNEFRYNNDPYAEDVARAVNYLLTQVGTYGGVPADDESDDGASPIPGTNDGIAYYVGDMSGYESINTALPIAAIAKSGLGSTAAQVGRATIGKSVEFVVQQLVDHIVYSQIDAGRDLGGWSYAPNDLNNLVCSLISGGWYYALMSAEQAMGQFGVHINDRVKNRIPNMLMTYQTGTGAPQVWYGRPMFEPAGFALMACKWLGWDTFGGTDETPAGYLPDPTVPKRVFRQVHDRYLNYITQSWLQACASGDLFDPNRVFWKDGNYDSATPTVGAWPRNLWTFSLFSVKQAAETGIPILSFGSHDWHHEFMVSLTKGQADELVDNHLDYYVEPGGSLTGYMLGPFATTAYAILAMSVRTQSGPVAVGTASPMEVIEGCSDAEAGKAAFRHESSFHSEPAHSIVEYRWNFNAAAGPIDWNIIPSGSYSADGRGWRGSSPSATPSYKYPHAGTYSAELTVLGDENPPRSNNTVIQGIRVMPMSPVPPTATAGGPYVLVQGSSLTLAGSATDPNIPCGDVLTYSWDLNGDGVFSDATGPAPTLSWAQLTALLPNPPLSQALEIILKVTDATSLSRQASTTLTIYRDVPIPVIQVVPPAASCNQPITFDAGASTHGDPRRTIRIYSWNLGDGTIADSKIVVHSYLSLGVFTISLTITDDAGKTASATTNVTVSMVNVKPVANPGGSYLAVVGDPLTLDGTQSSDPNAPCDAVASYSWDINGDGVEDLTGSNPTIPASVTSGWRAGGVYKVALRVKDSFGLVSDVAEAVIEAAAPLELTLPQNGSIAVPVDPATFSWNAFAGAVSYTLQYSTDADFANAVVVSANTETSQYISGLAKSTKYFWRVKAMTAGSISIWSHSWNFTTLSPPPVVTIVSTAGDNGSISPSGNQIVDVGTNITFTIKPNTGYHVADVLVDGASVGTVTSYPFSNVTENHTISASFAIDKFSITASAGSNGKIVPSGTVSVNYGENQSFAITPNAGFHVADVVVDGASVGAVANYPFTNVLAVHTIAASFAGDPGSISGIIHLGGGTLSNVTIKLLDANGNTITAFPPTLTNGQGVYSFANVPSLIDYQVMIVEPMGFSVDQNPKVVTVIPGGVSTLDFTLTQSVADNLARGMGYWKQQFDVATGAPGKAQETTNQLNSYLAAITERYAPHFNIFDDCHSFNDWLIVLNPSSKRPMRDKAKQQLAALLMNIVSLKLGQSAVVSLDLHTAGDALTYVSNAVANTNASNSVFEQAKNVAESVNNKVIVAAGIISAGGTLYKTGRMNEMPNITWDLVTIKDYALLSNYPNPFNPTTTIAYGLPHNSVVQLRVFDAFGRSVALLVNGEREAGYHEVRFDGTVLPSGVYFFRLQAGTFVDTKRMILLK